MTWWANFSSSPFLPNALSVFRGGVGFFLLFFLFNPSPFARLTALGLFMLGVATDHWDGWLARRYNHVTDFGKIMDPTMDKILILVPLCAFSTLGFYSPLWVIPIFIREFAVTFCRIGWILEGRAAGAENLGKLKFGFQVATLAFAFFYAATLNTPWTGFSAFCRGLMNLALPIALILTLASGFSFLKSNASSLQSLAFARFTSACGVGLLPGPAGTYGSLFGLVLLFLMAWNAWLYAILFLSIFGIGCWAVGKLDLSQVKDPQFVVVDEVLGILLTFAGQRISVACLFVGFFLFRVLDIVKPLGIRKLEKLPGYWGIVCDDLGAGACAWVLLKIFFH